MGRRNPSGMNKPAISNDAIKFPYGVLVPVAPPTIQQQADEWFTYYREKGFPFTRRMSSEQKSNELNLLRAIDFDTLVDLETKTFKSINSAGIQLAWQYFPHYHNIHCNTHKSPVEAFAIDKVLHSVMEKVVKMEGGISDCSVRQMSRFLHGTQRVFNFRPTVAACLYRYFCAGKPNATVWDMSSGFGGRLLGAFASRAVGKYIGTDPSTPTFNGLLKLAYDLRNAKPFFGPFVKDPPPKMEIELHKMGSEVFSPTRESLDVCFTSPPYFNCEKYETEETQSWIKFPTKNEWLYGFMKGTLENCIYGLKPDGLIAINVADVPSYRKLPEDLVKMVEEQLPLRHADTLFMETPKIQFLAKDATGKRPIVHKTKKQPIFVFKLK